MWHGYKPRHHLLLNLIWDHGIDRSSPSNFATRPKRIAGGAAPVIQYLKKTYLLIINVKTAINLFFFFFFFFFFGKFSDPLVRFF